MKTKETDKPVDISSNVLNMPVDSQAILSAIPDLIFRISRDGVYLDYKDASTIPLLLEPSEFLGKNVFDVVPEHIARGTMESIEKTARTHEPVIFHYQLELDGNINYYEARIFESGLENEFLAIIRNVSLPDLEQQSK